MLTSCLVVPEAPKNVRAAEVSERIENDCVILVTWDPPANSDGSDIGHYILNVTSRNIVDIESSAISVLRIPNCRSDDTIQVAAVNRFGCVGMNSSEERPSLFTFVDNNTQTGEGGSITVIPIEDRSDSSKYVMRCRCTLH